MKTLILSMSAQKKHAHSARTLAKDIVSYVPEQLTASDNVDLLYDKITESRFKKSLKSNSQGIFSLISLCYKFVLIGCLAYLGHHFLISG